MSCCGEDLTWVEFDNEDYRQPVDELNKETRLGGVDDGPPFHFKHDGGVYVLLLENYNFYIGKTNDYERRMEEHFTGEGARWTQAHHPKYVYRIHPYEEFDTENKSVYEHENEITVQFMNLYGVENVRGGDWTHPDLDQCGLLPKQFRETESQGLENIAAKYA